MNTIMASFDATVRQMTEMSLWPKCLSKKWRKCVCEKKTDTNESPWKNMSHIWQYRKTINADTSWMERNYKDSSLLRTDVC